MNPLEQYISIIHTRQQNPLPEGAYGEKHHIIPRACGGCNEGWNIVKLTAQEHFRCHCLLPLIYTTGEEHKRMIFAWRITTNSHDMSPDDYADFREEHARLMREKQSGVPKTQEHRRKLSEAHKGRETWMKGRRHTQASKEKMSRSRKGKPHRPHTAEEKANLSAKLKAYYAKRKAAAG